MSVRARLGALELLLVKHPTQWLSLAWALLSLEPLRIQNVSYNCICEISVVGPIASQLRERLWPKLLKFSCGPTDQCENEMR